MCFTGERLSPTLRLTFPIGQRRPWSRMWSQRTRDLMTEQHVSLQRTRGYGNNESCLIYYFNEQEQLYWCRICQCLSFHWENKINVTFPVYMYIDLVVCTKLKESIKSFLLLICFWKLICLERLSSIFGRFVIIIRMCWSSYDEDIAIKIIKIIHESWSAMYYLLYVLL